MGKTGRTVAVELAEIAVTTPEAGAKSVGKGRDVSVAVAMREADAPTAEVAKVTVRLQRWWGSSHVCSFNWPSCQRNIISPQTF